MPVDEKRAEGEVQDASEPKGPQQRAREQSHRRAAVALATSRRLKQAAEKVEMVGRLNNKSVPEGNRDFLTLQD